MLCPWNDGHIHEMGSGEPRILRDCCSGLGSLLHCGNKTLPEKQTLSCRRGFGLSVTLSLLTLPLSPLGKDGSLSSYLT